MFELFLNYSLIPGINSIKASPQVPSDGVKDVKPSPEMLDILSQGTAGGDMEGSEFMVKIKMDILDDMEIPDDKELLLQELDTRRREMIAYWPHCPLF